MFPEYDQEDIAEGNSAFCLIGVSLTYDSTADRIENDLSEYDALISPSVISPDRRSQ